MRVLAGGEWRAGCPDVHCGAGQYRIEVALWQRLAPVDGLYFVRPRSPRLLWNYAREVGGRVVLRKVVSRMSEALRNEKYVSYGVGRVVEAPLGGHFGLGAPVLFVVPSGPGCMERAVVPESLVSGAPEELPLPRAGELLYREAPPTPLGEDGKLPEWVRLLAGWHPESGTPLDRLFAARVLRQVSDLVVGGARAGDWHEVRVLETGSSPVDTALHRPAGKAGKRKRGLVLGYGNYTKVVMLPNVRRYLDVPRIHEIDPTQIPFESPGDVEWDTRPTARPGDDFDVHFVAGYHHHHAPLACQALRAGADAVVEKPIATHREDLAELLETLEETGGRFFACFERRYSILTARALADLAVPAGDPIHYHAVVYEVPLPERHWYRWASSRSRLVSNGCHWLDHFLFVNGYPDLRSYDLSVAPDGALNCSVLLENDAFGTIALTDRGSARTGVQDHVEMRAGDTTVRIRSSSRYEAESSTRVLRRERANKMDAYCCMYREIARKVAAGEPGDTLRAIQLSASLVLQLEDLLVERMRIAGDGRAAPAIARRLTG